MEILLMVVVFVVLMYVLMVLPQKRRMDQQRKMLSALEPGTRVMLNTGMFGTIRASGETQMVIELAPGVEVTVLKQAVTRVASPDEEEFEYTDGDAAGTTDEFNADVEQDWQVSPTTFAGDAEQSLPSTDQVSDADQPAIGPIDFAPPADQPFDTDSGPQSDSDDQSR